MLRWEALRMHDIVFSQPCSLCTWRSRGAYLRLDRKSGATDHYATLRTRPVRRRSSKAVPLSLERSPQFVVSADRVSVGVPLLT